jgi:hypothetical protein
MRTAHSTKLRRIAAAGAAGLIAWPVLAPAMAAAQSPAAENYTAGQVGLGGLALSAASGTVEKAVPLPGDWSGASVRGSIDVVGAGLRAGQTVRVLIDGTTVARTTLHDGAQSIAFATGNLPGGGVQLGIIAARPHGSLKHLGTITLGSSSGLSLTRTGVDDAVPSLSQLPGAIANHLALAASPLTVVLPAHPSATQLRAAMVASGAIAKADGGRGISVSVLEAANAAALDAVTGPVLTVEQTTSGPGRLSLTRLSSGSLDLTVAGTSRSLLDAARILSSAWMRSLSGDSATVPAGIVSQATAASTPTSADMAAATTSGTGTLSASSTFSLPVDQVIAKGIATLRIGVDYVAPAGGSVQVALNGNTLGTYAAPPQGQTLRVSTFKLSTNWTEDGNLLPSYFLKPGANHVTETATPPAGHRRSSASAKLTIDQGSGLAMSTVPRPPTEQLALWPFPFYGAHAWTRTTVVLARQTDPTTLGGLIAAMANAERITGVPADPAVTFAAPTAAQRAHDLIVVGSPGLAALAYSGPVTPGLLAEMPIIDGGVALVAYDAQSLGALGQGFEPGNLNGSAVLVSSGGAAQTIASAPAVSSFGSPSRPWLLPAALLAVLVLGWVAFQAKRARRRLVDLPEMTVESTQVTS